MPAFPGGAEHARADFAPLPQVPKRQHTSLPVGACLGVPQHNTICIWFRGNLLAALLHHATHALHLQHTSGTQRRQVQRTVLAQRPQTHTKTAKLLAAGLLALFVCVY
jgi:hypothetical protein